MATRNGSGAPAPGGPSFEELAARLEEVVARLEQGDLPLEQAVAEYERGVEIVRQCNEMLDQAELRISQLSASVARPAGLGPDLGSTASFLFDAEDEEDE
ncbi:MAG: exodeoxyribonuclease VII small subunit [Thermomicrobiaceae bacterium]|nr:exodeoxyribonuclease VII small subunit [Thermomicrobiaceae bacterium]